VKTSPLAVAFPSKPGPYQLLTTGSASASTAGRVVDATIDATVAPAASVTFVVGFIYVPPDHLHDKPQRLSPRQKVSSNIKILL
jgi:hypothetical protein